MRRKMSAEDALQSAAMQRLHERVMGAGRDKLEGEGALKNGTSADVMSQVGVDSLPPESGATLAQGGGGASGQAPPPPAAPPASMGDRLVGSARASDGDGDEDPRVAALRAKLLGETRTAFAPLRGSGRYGL